jgi:hypothetical protein
MIRATIVSLTAAVVLSGAVAWLERVQPDGIAIAVEPSTTPVHASRDAAASAAPRGAAEPEPTATERDATDMAAVAPSPVPDSRAVPSAAAPASTERTRPAQAGAAASPGPAASRPADTRRVAPHFGQAPPIGAGVAPQPEVRAAPAPAPAAQAAPDPLAPADDMPAPASTAEREGVWLVEDPAPAPSRTAPRPSAQREALGPEPPVERVRRRPDLGPLTDLDPRQVLWGPEEMTPPRDAPETASIDEEREARRASARRSEEIVDRLGRVMDLVRGPE